MKTSEAFPTNFLKASDLNGKSVRVTVDTVTMEKLGDDQKMVLHFIGKNKGLVLNKTNTYRIVEAVGSDETDDWEGWSITLYACKVDYQGKRVDAIRVDDRPGSTRKPDRATRQAAPPPPPADDFAEDAPPDLNDEEIPF